MGNLSFNKNSFINSEPTKISKPIMNDPTKLGRRTISDIKQDMHTLNKPIEKPSPVKIEDVQLNQHKNFNSLKAFRQWNKK